MMAEIEQDDYQLYITLRPELRKAGCVARTVEVVDDLVFIDYLADGRVFGIHIFKEAE